MEQSMEYVGVFGIMSTLKVGTIQDHTNSITAMSIDNAGRVTMPTRPAFACHLESTVALDGNNGWGATSGSNSLSSGAWDWKITHGGYNIGGHHNLSTNTFTAPIAGLYAFTASCVMAAAGNSVSFRFEQAGGTSSTRYAGLNFSNGNTVNSPSNNAQFLMAVNDTVTIQVGYTRSNSVEGDAAGFGRTWWSGYFVG